jgi:hypothetical protein
VHEAVYTKRMQEAEHHFCLWRIALDGSAYTSEYPFNILAEAGEASTCSRINRGTPFSNDSLAH